jgi:galactitol PTS system EIIA component
MLVFNENLVAFDLEARDAAAAIHVLAQKLHAQDLVAADYGQRVWARERAHPTGLPTEPFPIAFPHADAVGVHHPALAAALLRKPVTFRSMEDPDEELEVQIVLMLANKNPEEQIETLRNLAILFGQPRKLMELYSLSTQAEAANWLQRELKLTRSSAPRTASGC